MRARFTSRDKEFFGPRTSPSEIDLADGAADADARLDGQARQHGLEDLAADVVEKDVHAARAVLLEFVLDRSGLVVDAGVEAEFAHDPLALGRAAGDADHAAALDLRELACELSHGDGRARDDHRLTRLGLADLEQPEVGRQPGAAQHQPILERAQQGIDLGQIGSRHLFGADAEYSCTPSRPIT